MESKNFQYFFTTQGGKKMKGPADMSNSGTGKAS